MSKNKFAGWKDVFSFTLHQVTKGKAFKITTICFALCLFLIVGLANIITAATGNVEKVSPITVVQVLDESGFATTDFNMLSQVKGTAYSGITFLAVEAGKTSEELLKAMQSESNTEVLLQITKENEGFGMILSIPANSEITKKNGEALLKKLVPYFEMNKLTQIGLTEVQLVTINMPITTTFTSAGEAEETMGEIVIKMMAPMLFALMLYIMLLLYGQSICKSLVAEKTSKIMELILTSVTPYSLIIGKILAMTFMAIFQFILWISSAFAGFILGDYVAKTMYPEYQNAIMAVFKLIKESTNATAFSIPAILLAVLSMCMGFLFYSVIAGMVGAVLNKAEDLSTGMAIYQIPVMISFFMAYFIPLQEGSPLINFVWYFPFTAPFSAPANLIIGNMGIVEGGVSFIILSISTLLLILLTGKLYKGLVLFNGSKISVKNLIYILKTK